MENYLWLFCTLFATIGIVQSVDFPCLVSTVGNWTQRKSRGTISGIWATCGNVGNIFGLQIASWQLTRNSSDWYLLMGGVTLMYFFMATLICLLYVPKPADVNMTLPDSEIEKSEADKN